MSEPCEIEGCPKPAINDSPWCLRHLQAEQKRRAADEGLDAAQMTRPIREPGAFYVERPRPKEEAEAATAAARNALRNARLRNQETHP